VSISSNFLLRKTEDVSRVFASVVVSPRYAKSSHDPEGKGVSLQNSQTLGGEDDYGCN